MSISNRMDYLENTYDYYQGDIHYMINNMDLDGDDFNFLIELKEYRSGI